MKEGVVDGLGPPENLADVVARHIERHRSEAHVRDDFHSTTFTGQSPGRKYHPSMAAEQRRQIIRVKDDSSSALHPRAVLTTSFHVTPPSTVDEP